MSDIKGRCPHCREIYKVPSIYVGKEIKCPACKEPVIIEYKSPNPISDEQLRLNNLRGLKSDLRFTLCPIWFIICLLSYKPGIEPIGMLIGSVIGSLILTRLTVGLIELVTKYILAIIKSDH